eukprot:jgi/Botrbrau1/11853/Bobra.0175s0015.1
MVIRQGKFQFRGQRECNGMRGFPSILGHLRETPFGAILHARGSHVVSRSNESSTFRR